MAEGEGPQHYVTSAGRRRQELLEVLRGQGGGDHPDPDQLRRERDAYRDAYEEVLSALRQLLDSYDPDQ